MRRVSFILLLLVCALFLLQNRALAAQESPSDENPDEHADTSASDPQNEAPDPEQSAALLPITVTGHKTGHSGTRREILQGEEIRREGAKDLSEALTLLPSAHVTANTRGEQVFTLRGFDHRQVLVLLDGVPMLAPYRGEANIGLIPVEFVRRIDVLKGGGSLSHGAQGLGGAINVITRSAGASPLITGRYEIQPFIAQSASLAYSDLAGPLAWILTAGFSDREGFRLPAAFKETRNEDGGMRNNSDKRMLHAGLKLRLDLPHKQSLRLIAALNRARFGVPPETEERRPRFWRWPYWQSAMLQLVHESRPTATLKLEEAFFASFNDNTLEIYDDASYDSQQNQGSGASRYHDRMIGGRLRLTADFAPDAIKSLTWRTQADLRHNHHRSSRPGQDAEAPLESLIVQGESEIELAATEHITALAGAHVAADIPLFSADIDPDTSYLWGPTLGLVVYPARDLSIEFNAVRRGRFPSLSERFTAIEGDRLPNPGLGPETAWTMSADISYSPGRAILLKAGGYDSEVFDLIEERSLSNNQRQIRNIGRARLAGLELDLRLRFPFRLTIEGGYAYLHARNLSGANGSEPLEYRPPHKAYFKLASDPLPWLLLSTRVQFVSEQPYYDETNRSFGSLGAYYVWNASIEAQPGAGIRVWLRAENLLDMLYAPRFGFPAAGRSVWLGLDFAVR